MITLDKGISGAEALVFFYAVFWALVFNSVLRFRAFDTQLLFRRDSSWQATRRIGVALAIINVAPLIWFMFLYQHVVSHDYKDSSVVAAGLASMALPGFQRFLHAFLLSDFYGFHKHFYTDPERNRILREWRPIDDRVNLFNAMFLPGVGYLCAATCAALAWQGHVMGTYIFGVFLAFSIVTGNWAPQRPLPGLIIGVVTLWATLHFGITRDHDVFFWQDIESAFKYLIVSLAHYG